MDSLTQLAIQQKYDNIDKEMHYEDKQLAVRTLKTIRRSVPEAEINERNIKLVASLQLLLPPGRRVTSGLFRSWTSVVAQSQILTLETSGFDFFLM